MAAHRIRRNIDIDERTAVGSTREDLLSIANPVRRRLELCLETSKRLVSGCELDLMLPLQVLDELCRAALLLLATLRDLEINESFDAGLEIGRKSGERRSDLLCFVSAYRRPPSFELGSIPACDMASSMLWADRRAVATSSKPASTLKHRQPQMRSDTR